MFQGAALLACLAAPLPVWAQVDGGPPPGAEAPPPSVVPPKLVTFIEAPYPAEAEQARLEATVRLKLTLDDQGGVIEAQVLEPQGHGFDEAAKDAALRFRFGPARRDGVAVPSRIAYSYEFRLPVIPEPTVVTEAPGQARDVASEPTASEEPAPQRPSSPGEPTDGVVAWHGWKSSSERPPPVATPHKQVIQVDHEVDLNPPPPPPPQRVARADPPAPRVKTPSPAPRDSVRPARAEPARAGAVVTAKEPAAPLDFTDFDMTTGDAPRYAGGVTASTGRSTTAVNTVLAGDGEGTGTGGSRARSIQLSARSWSCPWPKEADTLRIDDQTVVLRVSVDAYGEVTSAELVSDPGHGFGQAALACARKARFDTALDREGRPYAAVSPPIRVRFVRP
ncbi:TonB family protein [Myxococcus fulvus]|uniref:TonB family protein n=1 Tax=Myxococcus fulvus TaxID=33 RepID=UPI00200AD903|nr:TonB family protein [Myxococcus fulvus]